MAGTEQIDVEQLLMRAYREKRVHMLGHARDGRADRLLSRLIGLTAPSTGASGWSTGGLVDNSSFAAKSVARVNAALKSLKLASDELLDAHDAVLGLPDFYVERGVGCDFLVWDFETAVRMGHKIDLRPEGASILKVRRRGGRRAGAEDLLPDGPRRPVVPIVTAALMVRHGSDASRPDVAEVVATGRRPIYRGADKAAVGYEAIYETDLATVALDRATYAVWHAALGMLAEQLAGLPGYTITGPHAPAAPWEGPAPVVRESLLDPVAPPPAQPYATPLHEKEWPKEPKPRKPRPAKAENGASNLAQSEIDARKLLDHIQPA